MLFTLLYIIVGVSWAKTCGTFYFYLVFCAGMVYFGQEYFKISKKLPVFEMMEHS